VKDLAKGDGRFLGRLAWKLRPTESLRIDALEVTDGRYIAVSSGSMRRLWAFVRVRLPDPQDDPKMDYASAMRISVQQQRIRGLFEGLYKSSIPFMYVSMMTQAQSSEEKELFEFDLAVGTWADGKWKHAEVVEQTLEQRASVLAATLTVALPSATVSRLLRGDLMGFAKGLYLPGEPALQQTADPATVATLVSFDQQNPQVGKTTAAPGFYVPNVAESGKSGVLLGAVKSGSGTFHDLYLQLEDLKRHVAILGMTGSGKSTTGAAIVRQVIALGLPVLVLDWHNEYGRTIVEAGGLVMSPGKDEFTTNPLEAGETSDPVEHLAMVSDIFSDIYHFSHPQAFMFRNALQKRMAECSPEEVLTLSSLVKTIEAYPLRSAYDNETKVALLRRLVPLTQGQAGRALDGPSTMTFGELLGKAVCIELGHLRDVQTRTVFAEIVLKTIYEQRVKEKRSLEHLTVVEEARNIAPARRAEDPASVGEKMISELRKFGEAMLFVAQFPSQIASEVVKNSGTRVVHRVAWPEDVGIIGDSMGLSQAQREHITKLGVGEAVVSLARIPKPVLVQVRADNVLGPRRDLSLAAES
jgi:hypothetical protein